ncbi:TPA: DEAD/DEAH box helicase family protein [Salmonella enterica subsp. enterica]|nr:restriction endonuclease [Salmonella enterica subsp. enterica]MBJ4389499.1 DEAD/DEAH box helicase family protein [Salmonella enterica subsp. enterica serovar Typhimurium]MBJ5449849.1 DEAD/DEAH box helicase family protein [Salmonella enterica subsp. enterica serovar Rissen]MBS2395997.1 DEAD/DEAH box helicase family protein [Salmonella enterica subsp. enterica serovar 1,4,[5],12:i:-]MCN0019827.1 DEAD/DEAH box helicase family protein [Salmonella enterica]
MAKKPKSVGSEKLLFNRLKQFDEPGLFHDNYQTPDYIQENLKDALRPYQHGALRYLHYTQRKRDDALLHYRHLLFHMATGAGKTMVMAGTILYLFKELGYQNFIFFVHTDAIIQKTRENLLNPQSPKYLFSQELEIDGEKITIEPIETFPSIPERNTIYLKLSTIHKMHDELNSYRENSITYEDLKEIPLVLLGDEAHHFNAGTKARGKSKTSPENEEQTWERTIENILNLRPDNRLFEFTATIDLANKDIGQKYRGKVVYQYDLKQFMSDGYSKKVMLLEANQNDSDKMLDAVLLSQYRKLTAADHGITGFKPVILFKSNKIAISKAKQEEFSQLIAAMTPESVRRHLANKKLQLSSDTSIWHKVIQRYANSDLVTVTGQIQEDFNDFNLLNVNKSDLLEENPVLLNTLEEVDNPVRAVFAVAKVNEGWDVLNLYDIVRISEQASSSKTSTDSEAQLIGRGARYYPFIYDGQRSFTRRFDNSTKDLSVLEQLHYHTINEPAYIKTLHASLEQADIDVHQDGGGTIEHARLKEDFKKSAVYQAGKLYFNEVEEIESSSRNWETYSLETRFEIPYQTVCEESLDNLTGTKTGITKPELLVLDERFYRKAMQRISFYALDNLQRFFPKLTGIREFIRSDAYLGKLTITVIVPQSLDFTTVPAKDKLHLLETVLLRISENVRRNDQKVKGTYRFISQPVKEVIKDYSLHIDPSVVINQKITAAPTIGKKWYVYDNAILNQLEHRLIKTLEAFMPKLKARYDDIYVLRNDEQSTRFKLTEFGGVRGFMPDFIMILTRHSDNTYWQVFLEPKGDDRLLDDAWKERMLETLNDRERIVIDENEHVRLVGIKFFANSQMDVFVSDMQNKLNDGESLETSSLSLPL